MLAHEIGHTFGAVRDGESSCADVPAYGYLMSASSSGVDTFSQCSIEKIKHGMETFGDCLTAAETPTEPSNTGSSGSAGSSSGSSGSTTPANTTSSGAQASKGGGGGSMDHFFVLGGIATALATSKVQTQLRSAPQCSVIDSEAT